MSVIINNGAKISALITKILVLLLRPCVNKNFFKVCNLLLISTWIHNKAIMHKVNIKKIELSFANGINNTGSRKNSTNISNIRYCLVLNMWELIKRIVQK